MAHAVRHIKLDAVSDHQYTHKSHMNVFGYIQFQLWFWHGVKGYTGVCHEECCQHFESYDATYSV